uniref:Uncharacterized protein n=1 Tax=Xiphophorus couchianus TaxID=32473 RepID=A0A3B5MGG1_9TELE
MGCDGGTIPKRHELVKGPKKVEKVDKNAELAAKWKYCALSQEKLRRPIVSCELGRLYNKDAIIEYLLDKSAERPNAEAVTHIRGIKDIKELNLTDNPEWEGERRNAKGDRYEDIHCGMFICPVVVFSFLIPKITCGCAKGCKLCCAALALTGSDEYLQTIVFLIQDRLEIHETLKAHYIRKTTMFIVLFYLHLK